MMIFSSKNEKNKNFEILSRGLESPSNSKTLIIWSFFLSFFLGFFLNTWKTTPGRSCPTSPPGGNQVDGLPPAPSNTPAEPFWPSKGFARICSLTSSFSIFEGLKIKILRKFPNQTILQLLKFRFLLTVCLDMAEGQSSIEIWILKVDEKFYEWGKLKNLKI